MSTINAANSSMRETFFGRSGSSTTADAGVENMAVGAAMNDRGSSSTVELSDHAKTLLAKAQEDAVVAKQLAAYLQAMRSKGAAAAATTWTTGGAQSEPGNSGQITDAMAAVKKWAKLDVFRNAANAVADDQVRALVRDGQLPQLPPLDEEQWNSLSEAEQNVYGTVRSLQGLYDSMPKTLEQALSDHVNSILETHPDAIDSMKSGLASNTLKAEDGWEGIIARYETELAAAQQGKIQIHAVNDPALVQTESEFTVSRGAVGWSARGITVNGNFPNLYETFGTKNVRPGSSPYTGDYVITW